MQQPPYNKRDFQKFAHMKEEKEVLNYLFTFLAEHIIICLNVTCNLILQYKLT